MDWQSLENKKDSVMNIHACAFACMCICVLVCVCMHYAHVCMCVLGFAVNNHTIRLVDIICNVKQFAILGTAIYKVSQISNTGRKK